MACVVLFLLFLCASTHVGAKGSEDSCLIQFGVDSFDQDSGIIRTRYFRMSVTVFHTYPVTVHMFYRNPYDQSDEFPVRSTYNSDIRGQVLEISWETLPERGSHPWKWPLISSGDFPHDRYELNLVIGFTVKADFRHNSTDVRLPEELVGKWNATTRFARFPVEATLSQLNYLRIDEHKFRDAVRSGCCDFYQVTVILSRPAAQIYRFDFHWSVAMLLLMPLVISFLFLPRLKLHHLLALCLGIAFFAVPNLVWLQSYLPQGKLHLIELIYMVEIGSSIVLVFLAILLKVFSRGSDSGNALPPGEHMPSVRSWSSIPPMHFGTELDYDLAIDELRWLKNNKGQLEQSDFSSVAVKYAFPTSFLAKGFQEGLSPEDYVISTSKWFPVIYAWAAHRKRMRMNLIEAFIGCGRAYILFSLTTFLVISSLANLVTVFHSLGITDPAQLGLNVVLPYATFAVPYLHWLWERKGERKKAMLRTINIARENRCNYLVQAVDKYLAKYVILAIFNPRILERDLPERVVYRIERPDAGPIVITENPEQEYLKRLRSQLIRDSPV